MTTQCLKNARTVLVFVSLQLFIALPALAASYRQVDVPGSTYTVIYGVNSSGQMVGQYLTASGGSGFVYSKGQFTNVNYPGTTKNAATGINDRGDIVGNYSTNQAGYGFLYKDGQFTSISYPGATTTQVNSINNVDDIVGGYLDQAGTWHGFLLHQGVFASFQVHGADFTSAYGINDQGIISGYSHTYCDNNCDIVSGFLFYGGQVHPGSANTEFYGINTRDEVVGDCNVARGANMTGCLLTQHQSLSWNYPNTYSTKPYGINNSSVVVGETVDYSNVTHGFVAQP